MGIYSMMSSAFYVMIQMSIFGNKLGERVAPEIVTVRDNPAAYSVANRAFDDEGVPAGEKAIIDRGVLKTYLHNTSTAKIFGGETTGQNYITGDFSTIPRDGAFLVEGGEITGSLKDIRISDNAMRMLNGVKAMSRERQHVHWWEMDTPTLTPYVLIEGVKITRPR